MFIYVDRSFSCLLNFRNSESKIKPIHISMSAKSISDADLSSIPEQDRNEAIRIMEIAKKAEMLAEARQSEKSNIINKNDSDVKFLSKSEREALALERLKLKRATEEDRLKTNIDAYNRFALGTALEERKLETKLLQQRELEERARRQREENKEAKEQEFELSAIRDQYFGHRDKKQKIIKVSADERLRFKQLIDRDEDNDTTKNDMNPLYGNRVKINTLFGRGYIAGIDQREQRKDSTYLASLSQRRLEEIRHQSTGTSNERLNISSNKEMAEAVKLLQTHDRGLVVDKYKHWSEKQRHEMTERDWRIYREDNDIRIQGGKALNPIRNWKEGELPESVMKAIIDLGYEKPSPIQSQAIPIGQAWRDIMGIAETGSGKTAAFIIPLLCYLLSLSKEVLQNCADNGPFAVILAPTRELALQIDEEFYKLSKYTEFSSACIIGGTSIEEQGFILRKGVQIVVGTPGRLCDCLQNHYLVLNQCNYVVLDEADLMIDMGFESQVTEILDAMGSTLKSEEEEIAYIEAEKAQQGNGHCRVTTMFSATMLPDVERIAKRYLRHPAVIKIGDESSGKNKRIEQIVYMITEQQKRGKLNEILSRLSNIDKVIIFLNNKNSCDVVGKFVESLNYRVGILHSRKSQDQREETLERFRDGHYKVLVATDVAGRGLDIKDVTYVINYDCPLRIDDYCHRIGRTGRAGKSGTAVTLLTESDTEIMFPLRNYLESTNAVIPQQLKHHPNAQAPSGARDEKGNIIVNKRDKIQYAK